MVSKLGNTASFGSDPRRVETAGNQQFGALQEALTATIQARYDSLKMSYEKPNNSTIMGGDVAKDSTVDSIEKESLIFFFHPDHLGSTSYVTGADGTVAQHVEYIPYGEVFVEERSGTVGTANLFNAKELDSETGMYYYGARYLDPTEAMWISVDPMWEKFAGMSAYNYCAGNPVKMVDPDGREHYLKGSRRNVKMTIKIHNASMGGYCKASVGKDGKVSLGEVNKNAKATSAQKNYYAFLSKVVNDEKTTTINVKKGTKVQIGDAQTATIDIGDIKKLNGKMASTTGALMHETWEQYEIQAKGKDVGTAHMSAVGREGTVTEYTPNHDRYLDESTMSMKVVSDKVVTNKGVDLSKKGYTEYIHFDSKMNVKNVTTTIDPK